MSKPTKINIATTVFIIVSFIDMYAVIQQEKTLELIFKPLLMTTLAVVYLISVKKPSFWVLSALFFSFLGDVFLLDKTNYFIFGLASFLLAHIIYIKITTGFLQKDLTTKIITSSIPFIVLFTGLLYLIYNNLHEMLLPVIVYGITIATFGTVALLNYKQKKSTANLWLLLGAILFIASDSFIALNNFYNPKHLLDVSIITLYIVSQYLIVKALITKEI